MSLTVKQRKRKKTKDRNPCYRIRLCFCCHLPTGNFLQAIVKFLFFLFCLFTINICILFYVAYRIRRAAHWIVNLRYFDFFIMLIIILSSVALAAEDPINDDSDWNNYLDVVDNVFTVIFAIEMILKVRSSCRTRVKRKPFMARIL